MAGKHSSAAVAAASKIEPVPVKAAVVGAEMVRGRHRAPTSRGRHSVDMRGKSPANTPHMDAARGTRGTRTLSRSKSADSAARPTTRYVGKGSLYTPRSSRTRYIRYIGNNDTNHTGKLIGEWLLGVVLICIAVPKQAANAGYQKTITRIMYRLTALTAVFFVLALMSDTRGGKTAVYAGLLIDLGIVFNMVQTGTVAGITQIMTGKPIVNSGTEPAADITHPAAFQINSGVATADNSAPSGGGGGGGNQPMPA